jgi:hypothetical protein
MVLSASQLVEGTEAGTSADRVWENFLRRAHVIICRSEVIRDWLV